MLLVTAWRVTGVGSSPISKGEAIGLMGAMRKARDNGSIKDARNESKNVVFSYCDKKTPVRSRMVLSDGSTTYVIPGDGDHSVAGDMIIYNIPDVVGTLLAAAKEGYEFVAYKRPRKEISDDAEWSLVDKDHILSLFAKAAPDKKGKEKPFTHTIGEAVKAAEEQKEATNGDAVPDSKKPAAKKTSKKATKPATKATKTIEDVKPPVDKETDASTVPEDGLPSEGVAVDVGA